MLKNPYSGKFIAIEGIDGTGKSTQAAMLANLFLGHDGITMCLTAEPSQFMVGGLVRSRLLGEWFCTPECLQLMFAADRAEHLAKEIVPRLKEGISVVSDRYFLSSLAYGAVDCDLDWLGHVNSRFIVPDLTIFLDADAKICAQRIADNGKSIELFEGSEVLEKVHKNYLAAIGLFEKEMPLAIIDGNSEKQIVFENVKKAVQNLFTA
ncbi:MAG: dTMP kinase [Candidatus Pacebacteria bacterium]|jgi:dTMP kinase|nr:dTMP kinase [Candidatus Paceibacterota bacterium]